MGHNSYATIIEEFYVSAINSPREEQKNCNHEWGEEKDTIIKREKWRVLSDGYNLYPTPTGEYKNKICKVQTCMKCGLTRAVPKKRKTQIKKTLIPNYLKKY